MDEFGDSDEAEEDDQAFNAFKYEKEEFKSEISESQEDFGNSDLNKFTIHHNKDEEPKAS